MVHFNWQSCGFCLSLARRGLYCLFFFYDFPFQGAHVAWGLCLPMNSACGLLQSGECESRREESPRTCFRIGFGTLSYLQKKVAQFFPSPDLQLRLDPISRGVWWSKIFPQPSSSTKPLLYFFYIYLLATPDLPGSLLPCSDSTMGFRELGNLCFPYRCQAPCRTLWWACQLWEILGECGCGVWREWALGRGGTEIAIFSMGADLCCMEVSHKSRRSPGQTWSLGNQTVASGEVPWNTDVCFMLSQAFSPAQQCALRLPITLKNFRQRKVIPNTYNLWYPFCKRI